VMSWYVRTVFPSSASTAPSGPASSDPYGWSPLDRARIANSISRRKCRSSASVMSPTVGSASSDTQDALCDDDASPTFANLVAPHGDMDSSRPSHRMPLLDNDSRLPRDHAVGGETTYERSSRAAGRCVFMDADAGVEEARAYAIASTSMGTRE
jgi:hypothetical protein